MRALQRSEDRSAGIARGPGIPLDMFERRKWRAWRGEPPRLRGTAARGGERPGAMRSGRKSHRRNFWKKMVQPEMEKHGARGEKRPRVDIRSVSKPALARPPPSRQTARRGHLNFLSLDPCSIRSAQPPVSPWQTPSLVSLADHDYRRWRRVMPGVSRHGPECCGTDR